MSYVYWFVSKVDEHENGVMIPDDVSAILDDEHGGLSFAAFPDGTMKGVIVTKELVTPNWLQSILDVDMVEFVREEQLGPGSVIVDREGLRLQLAE